MRIIALGFLATIFVGSLLLMLPICLKSGVSLSYVDSLYTSTSAVCVTGLSVVDAGSTFSPIGQAVLISLIQVGGLGVATIGAGIMLAVGKKMNLKGVNVIKTATNSDSGRGLKGFIRDIFITTVLIELAGAFFSFFVFVQDMPIMTAIGVSFFHSISSFNNAGFDIFGGIEGFSPFESLLPYRHDVLLNLITASLIILGGIGFLVIRDVRKTRFRWKKFSMHTKVVLSVSATLIVSGALLFKLTEDVSWLEAFFCSVSARTAGFATFSLSGFSVAGILVLVLLMFIGASPGSTGGGIKTTTFFAVLQGLKSSATNKAEKAFHYAMPKDSYRQASVIAILAFSIILASTYFVAFFDPQFAMRDILMEMTSAFNTVGLSTGITPALSIGSKIVSIIVMYMGRLGPMTVASLWYFSRGEYFTYPEGNLTIG